MRYSRIFVAVLAFFAAVASNAQSSQSGSGPGASEPAGKAPAASDSHAAAPAAGSTVPKDQAVGKEQAKDKKKPKRVWTDEEISAIGGTISVVGDAKSRNNSAPSQVHSRSSAAADAASYRSRLAPLREQLEAIDREIQEMKSAKGSVRENIESQVQIREARRAKILAQINEIEEDARRHGVAPGDLR